MLQVVKCFKCDVEFYRPINKYNEAIKFGWKQYCSVKCQSLSKLTGQKFLCSRLGCGNKFYRSNCEVSKSEFLYCSRRCAAIVNNTKYLKHPGIIKKCSNCDGDFKSREKFCSMKCKNEAQKIPVTFLFKEVKDFFVKNERIPLKREFGYYAAIRGRFGTWNNFIRIAGFEPNPVMFAKKYIAKDGHKCDSLAEKIIDDWLYRRKIPHQRSFPYPGKNGFTVDFKINNYWIEFFGLHGELKRYDELMKRKFEVVKEYNLKLIQLYPADLFPVGKLNERFRFLL